VPDAYTTFRKLHEGGCFVLPNPWDVGSARRLAVKGFKALASTSAGTAWALGKQDGEITLDECLAHLRMLCTATDLPVNADFESGFADSSEGVATSVARAMETGVAGLSIEDRVGKTLYPIEAGVERIRAARTAIDRTEPRALLVGRTEGFLVGRDDLAEVIRRLKAYSDAGADVLYAPGLRTLDQVAEVVAAVAPKPVNVLLGFVDASVSELAATGARRLSTGAALAAAAWKGLEKAADTLIESGRLPPRG